MKITDIEKLFKMMKSFGVEHFKSEELEIKMGNVGPAQKPIEVPKESKPKPERKGKIPPQQAIPIVDLDIPHRLSEVTNMLKMSDSDLAETLFPDYSQLSKKQVNNG